MKKIIEKYAVIVAVVLVLALLLPGLATRVQNEEKNNTVVLSLLYNDLLNKVTQKKLNASMEDYKALGLRTVSVMEDDLNALVARGDITCIKYNVLRHKYDEESIQMADFIAQNCPDISYDSYVVIVSRDYVKEKLAYHLPRRYDETQYNAVGSFGKLDIYVFYDGKTDLWNYTVGYDEQLIADLTAKGFEVALVHKVKNYARFDYLEDIQSLVEKYDIEYLNLKEDGRKTREEQTRQENYEGICDILLKNDMTLVVTENPDQLSNQKFFGYAYIFDAVMQAGGPQKILRAYETYDDSQSNETIYKHRVEQYLNSTIDRSLRFIVVTQITSKEASMAACADYTLQAVKEYKQKIEKLGFNVNTDVQKMDYTVRRSLNSALAAALMVLCVLLMLQMVLGKKHFWLSVGGIGVAALAFLGTFVLPDSLVLLYPTVFCVVQSCMAITVMLYFLKAKSEKWPLVALIPAAVGIVLGVLLLGALGLGTLLSGLDYYVNNLIFRGIKLSLLVPIAYTTLVYYWMFIKAEGRTVLQDIKTVLNVEIKVWWLLLAAVVGVVGLYYIIRSGNVSSISDAERLLRTTVTEIFTARPRTKEFLIGYPALVLFVYYMKKSDLHLIKWLFAIAMSILAASVTNSFCHVFTDFSVIVSRTLNGFVLGVCVSVAVYIANWILHKVICRFIKGA